MLTIGEPRSCVGKLWMELWGLVGKAAKPGHIAYSFAWSCAAQHERTRAKLNSRAFTRKNSRRITFIHQTLA